MTLYMTVDFMLAALIHINLITSVGTKDGKESSRERANRSELGR